MSWTYSGDPASSTKDTIRFLVGDTLVDEPLCSDEEIAWAITQNSDTYAAAALIANGISTYFARMADAEEIGPIKTTFNNRIKYYTAKAKELEAKVGSNSGLIFYAGGISVSDKLANNSDTDREPTAFSKGMNDTPLSTLFDDPRES